MEGLEMGVWMPIESWPECHRMAKPGIIFELSNAEGKSMFTPCVMPLPPAPFDWKSMPVRFRAIPEPAPQHSAPLPAPGSK